MRPCGSSRELWEFPASLPPSRTAPRERARGSRFPNSCGAGPWHSSPGCSSLSFPRNHSGMLGEGLGWDSRGFSSPAVQENPWMGEGLVVATPSRESFALCHGLQGKRPQSLLEALENWECLSSVFTERRREGRAGLWDLTGKTGIIPGSNPACLVEYQPTTPGIPGIIIPALPPRQLPGVGFGMWGFFPGCCFPCGSSLAPRAGRDSWSRNSPLPAWNNGPSWSP